MDDLISQVTIACFTTVLGALVGAAFTKIAKDRESREKLTQEQVRERDENRESMRLLLGYRLSDLFRRYVVEASPITTAEKHEVEDVYEHYHAYGGNGEGTRKYKAIMALKTTD